VKPPKAGQKGSVEELVADRERPSDSIGEATSHELTDSPFDLAVLKPAAV
jgi:hypothetical protein